MFLQRKNGREQYYLTIAVPIFIMTLYRLTALECAFSWDIVVVVFNFGSSWDSPYASRIKALEKKVRFIKINHI